MLLYGLYATNQDDEARRVLRLAGRKTEFDTYQKQQLHHYVRHIKLLYGEPVSSLELLTMESAVEPIGMHGKFRTVARWVMDSFLNDWRSEQRGRALEVANDGVKLARVMRREGYSNLDYSCGRSTGGIFLTVPAKLLGVTTKLGSSRSNSSLIAWKNYPGSLYSLARENGSIELLSGLQSEWSERQLWASRLTSTATLDNYFENYAGAPLISGVERLRLLIVCTTPSLVIAGLLFLLLGRRFPVRPLGVSLFWKGARFGLFLYFIAMICDAALLLNDTSPYLGWEYMYIWPFGLSSKTVSWTAWGFAAIAICYSTNLAVRWQKSQGKAQPSFLNRVRTVLAPPEDGLARFDFGWLLGLVARLSLWLIFLGAVAIACWDSDKTFVNYFWAFPAVLTGYSFLANGVTWLKGKRRRETLFLAFNIIYETLTGFFVTSSVLYALLSFAVLPLEFKFQRDFENRVEQGEVPSLRAKFAL